MKSDFALIFQRQSRQDQKLQTTYGLSSEIYNEVLDKVCNSSFNEVMDNYAEKNSLKGKGKIGLCTILLASVSAKQEDTAGATITASPTPTFNVLLLGENGAVSTKLLNGSVFVLTGVFNEVSTHRVTEEEEIKKMIKSFGGEVKKSFSVNTSECTRRPGPRMI